MLENLFTKKANGEYDLLLHPGQGKLQQIINNNRFVAVLAGRRWGKTRFCLILSILALIEGKNVAYVVPDYSKCETTFGIIVDNLGLMGHKLSSNKMEKIIKSTTGGVFRVYSADSNSDVGRGEKFDLVIVDEASLIKNLQHLINASLIPTLTDRQGKLLIISTPKNINSDFYKLFIQFGSLKDGKHSSYSADSYENTFIPNHKQELDYLKQILPPEIFSQEILAIPSRDTGSPFGDITSCLIALSDITDRAVSYYGIDLASRVDFTSIIGLNTNNQVVDYHNFQDTWAITKERIKHVVQHTPAIADRTGVGDVVLDDLKQMGCKHIDEFVLTNKTKQEIITKLAIGLKNGKLKIPANLTKLIDQLNSYEYAYKDGTLTFNAPSGQHDDDVISLALAYYKNDCSPLVISQFYKGSYNDNQEDACYNDRFMGYNRRS